MGTKHFLHQHRPAPFDPAWLDEGEVQRLEIISQLQRQLRRLHAPSDLIAALHRHRQRIEMAARRRNILSIPLERPQLITNTPTPPRSIPDDDDWNE